MIHCDVEQGSDAWISLRLGKVTASRIADVMAKGRGNAEAASRRNYRAQLVAERLTGQVADSFVSYEMQWGTEHEPAARECYEFLKSVTVEQVAFADHPKFKMAGASPDGLPPGGLLEIKCPNTATHIDMLTTGKIDSKYIKQMQFQMACTDAPWCDFVSYDPRIGRNNHMFVTRVFRDEEMISEINDAVELLLSEVDETVERLSA